MDFDYGTPNIVIGYDNAEMLFGKPEKAVGKEVSLRNKKAIVVGVVKKQGKSFVDGWEFDKSIVLSYKFMKQMLFNERWNNPKIIIKGPDDMSSDALKDELKGAMRSIRRLGPTEEDDFALNAISDFSKSVSNLFGSVNLGGWLIGLLSLIVGAFGIANIMFVTVRERTPIIGLKSHWREEKDHSDGVSAGECAYLYHRRTNRHHPRRHIGPIAELGIQLPHICINTNFRTRHFHLHRHRNARRYHSSDDCIQNGSCSSHQI